MKSDVLEQDPILGKHTPVRLRPKDEVVQFKLPGLARRIAQEHNLSIGEAEQLVQDLARFLYLCAEWKGKKAFYPPVMIDAAWHEFLQFTMDYYKFCMVNFGCMIHHVPFTDENKPIHDTVESARPFAELHFGQLSKFWAEKGKDCSECGDCSPVACGHR